MAISKKETCLIHRDWHDEENDFKEKSVRYTEIRHTISHMRSRMRESCKSGSVRDASCKRCVYSTPYTKGIKEALIDLLEKSGMKYQVNGTSDKSISSTLNICIDGVASEALMISMKQFCALSNGSACTSKNYSPSYVLMIMEIPTEQIENSIRISWGPDTDRNEVLKNFTELLEITKQIRG